MGVVEGGLYIYIYSLTKMMLILLYLSMQEIFMTHTCQAVFGPHSDNTLPPQAVAGEHIRIILPARNLFHTPLLLKKVHLLWKFCSLEAHVSHTVSRDNTEPRNEKDDGDCTSVYR